MIDANFQTPIQICEYMVSLIPAESITVLEPTPGHGNLVSVMGKYKVTAPENFYLMEKRMFDVVVMNPPFSPMKKGYEILYSCMEISDIIIALMPWLTIINSKKRAYDIRNFGLKSVTHLPRDVFPGTRVQTCIIELNKGFNKKTELIIL